MSKQSPQQPDIKPQADKIKCGVIMPIAPIDDCPASHWAEVLEIIKESLDGSSFYAEIVSSSPDTAIIHRTIVKNVYENEIVICDVSARNPNVMLELGMRLAFDKPVVVIKDDATPYSFDTSPIEHLEYPRDLRFAKIKNFKTELLKKVLATHEVAKSEKSFFLKDYPLYKTSTLPEEQVSAMQAVMAEINELKSSVNRRFSQPTSERFVMRVVKPNHADELSQKLLEEGRTIKQSGFLGGNIRILVSVLEGETPSAALDHVKNLHEAIEIPF